MKDSVKFIGFTCTHCLYTSVAPEENVASRFIKGAKFLGNYIKQLELYRLAVEIYYLSSVSMLFAKLPQILKHYDWLWSIWCLQFASQTVEFLKSFTFCRA
ncbi:hypothetical protein BRADI_3g37073v3 [Brachypodium distachyon]|uniref:Uncharacterized protein n=1 Tax=Brachypodium distachyon TaxID=15368 RepID=A0A0Q3FH26_BRADI|nr:hypothetical protein BRADI_3g37073v3 [Brachypodium distachyon]